MSTDISILSYPLNNKDYIAEDARLYFATRESGVYSSNRHFIISTVAGSPMTLKLSSGIGWMKFAEFEGIVFCNKEEVTLQLQTSHPALPRIDRIVIRYDISLNDVFITVKPGVAASVPVGAILQRDLEAWELCVAEIIIAPGTIILTQSSVRDTRFDESLCGIMRDGVTGIPTQAMYDSWYAWFDELKIDAGEKANLFNAWMNAFIVDNETAFTEWLSNFKFTRTEAFNNWLVSFTTDNDNRFENWFTNLQNQLNDNQAANIQNQLNQHSEIQARATNGVHGIRLRGDRVQIFIGNGWATFALLERGMRADFISSLNLTSIQIDDLWLTSNNIDNYIEVED